MEPSDKRDRQSEEKRLRRQSEKQPRMMGAEGASVFTLRFAGIEGRSATGPRGGCPSVMRWCGRLWHPHPCQGLGRGLDCFVDLHDLSFGY